MKTATLWLTLNQEQDLSRTALTIASILSAGDPKTKLLVRRHNNAFEDSIFVGASSVVVITITRMTGILTTHLLAKSKEKLRTHSANEVIVFFVYKSNRILKCILQSHNKNLRIKN